MKKITRHYKRLRVRFIKVALFVVFINILFLPQSIKITSEGDNLFRILLTETEIGYGGKQTDIKELLRQARLRVAEESDGMVYADAKLAIEGSEVIFGAVDSEASLQNKMEAVLNSNRRQTLKHAYTVKIKNYTVNLASSDETTS